MNARVARFGRTITGLRPDRLFLGPAFSVALRVASRRRATYVARGLYALFVAVFVVIAAGVAIGESADGAARGLGSAARVQTLQAIAPGSAISLAWLQFVAAVLLGPVGAGLMLGDEKRSGALAVVLTTPMSALQLVCARLTSHMVLVALVMSLSIPVLLGLRVFGGLEAGAILRSAALSLAVAATGASLAMATSLVARRGSVASGVAQAGVVVSFFAMPLGAGLWAYITDGTPAAWTLALSAPIQLVWVMGLGIPMPGMPGGDGALLACLGYHAVLTAFGLVLAARRVRASVAGERVGARVARKDAAVRGVEASEHASARRADVPKAGGRGGDATTARVSREVGDRPVRWREVRVFRVRRGWVVPAVTGVLACGLVWLHAEGDPVVMGYMITLLLGVMMVAYGAVMSGSAVAGEKELRTFDPLMTTPMSAAEILSGKLAGVLVRMWPAWVLFGLHTALLAASGEFPWLVVPMVWACWAPVALVMVMSGLWLSVLCRRGSVASSWNVAVGVGVWAAAPMLAAMVGSAATALGADLSPFGMVILVHPIARTITAVEGLAEEDAWLLATFRGPMPEGVGVFGFLGILGVLGAAELGAAWALWRSAVWSLGRRTLRRG